MRSVILTGPPGSGKSILARHLARALGLPHVDLDAAVERAAGRPIATLFARDGEPRFRDRERAVLRRCLAAPRARVIAAGGGALLDRAMRHEALRTAWVISLDAPHEVLLARLRADRRVRPLLEGDMDSRLRTLLDARRDTYAEAHARVDTSAGEPARVAPHVARVVRDLERHATFVMPLGSRSYLVRIAPLETLGGVVRAHAPSSTVLVTDPRVARIADAHGVRMPRSNARVVLRPAGERAKTLTSVEQIWNAALAAGLDRSGVLVGVGGGVVTDLTGFAAATLLRGVRFVAAPTTLLAMADASVGGKTAFDHARGKNLIGAFHQPSHVVCDDRFVAWQPERDRRAGIAEIAKIAIVRDARMFGHLATDAERLCAGEPRAIRAALAQAIDAKIAVVSVDEREAGLREVLNFGHTFGHAIERAAGYRMAHGLCVAIGMRAALTLGQQLGVTPATVAREVHALLDALRLPRRLPSSVTVDAVLAALGSDKKRRAGTHRFVLCESVGHAVVVPASDLDAHGALCRLHEIRHPGPS